MTHRSVLLQNIVDTIADYREGEISPPDQAHVDKWVKQFPAAVQEPILKEMAHVLGKTYFKKKEVKTFIEELIGSEKFAGADPCTFWKGVKFLDLQTAGNSQRDMLSLFERKLRKKCGLDLGDCGKNPHTYLYLDDALFSGGRIKSDLIKWINGPAPSQANVAVVTIAIHSLGLWFATKDIAEAIKQSNKKIEVSWWRLVEVEDRKAYMASSDVLRPTIIPSDSATQAYVAGLGAQVVLRTGSGVGGLGVFSSDAGRQLLEQEFLKAGVRVRGMCPYLNTYMRPLGCSLMKTTGFGSTIVTYRNCANNTPLVLWAGNPWHPLFPRKTN